MATTATRVLTITYTGDVTGTETISAASNASSPGQIQIISLVSGNNTITVPTAGTVPTACTIVPPSNNANTLILKGVAGDTGITILKTDPTTIALDPGVTTFVVNAAGTTNTRFVWS